MGAYSAARVLCGMGSPAWVGRPIDAGAVAGIGFYQELHRMAGKLKHSPQRMCIMAGLIGNNPEDMADLASKLGHAVDEIHQLTSSLDGKANSVQWQGPDADRFKHTDWPTYKSQLSKVAQNLQEVQQKVNKQKQDQISTSAH
jgi:uncharacterized protein YukE